MLRIRIDIGIPRLTDRYKDGRAFSLGAAFPMETIARRFDPCTVLGQDVVTARYLHCVCRIYVEREKHSECAGERCSGRRASGAPSNVPRSFERSRASFTGERQRCCGLGFERD